MALLYRHSPTYVGSNARRSNRTAHEPSLAVCSSCSLTCLVPLAVPAGAPVNPPAYSPTPSPPSTPTSPTCSISSKASSKEWRSHDHSTIFVKAAGVVNSVPTKTLRRPGNSVEAGIGVSFATPSRYDFCERIPSSIAAGDQGVKRMVMTPNRTEVYAAIRALDRVNGLLAAGIRDRSDGGFAAAMGLMQTAGGQRRLAPGVTLPSKVEEVVILTRSEYLISAITAPEDKKPWRSTPVGQRHFAAAAFIPTGGRDGSLSALSNYSRTSTSSRSEGQKRRAWLTRKSSQAHKSDFDLLMELDILVEQLGERYGVRVCFHKAVVGEATKLAKKGAIKEEGEY